MRTTLATAILATAYAAQADLPIVNEADFT
jgi:hypothetical protein